MRFPKRFLFITLNELLNSTIEEIVVQVKKNDRFIKKKIEQERPKARNFRNIMMNALQSAFQTRRSPRHLAQVARTLCRAFPCSSTCGHDQPLVDSHGLRLIFLALGLSCSIFF